MYRQRRVIKYLILKNKKKKKPYQKEKAKHLEIGESWIAKTYKNLDGNNHFPGKEEFWWNWVDFCITNLSFVS